MLTTVIPVFCGLSLNVECYVVNIVLRDLINHLQIRKPMRNRAKCKLCNSIIESMHSTDLQVCNCGHISVDAGEGMRCSAGDWSNFLRVDDNDNEIIVKVESYQSTIPSGKATKKEMIEYLKQMKESIERLPPQAMTQHVTEYELYSLISLLVALFTAED